MRATLRSSASRPATAWTRMPSHFHSAMKLEGSITGTSLSSSGWERIAAFRRARFPLDPGKEVEIGRRDAVPDFLDLVGIPVAERGERGLCEARRNPDATPAG